MNALSVEDCVAHMEKGGAVTFCEYLPEGSLFMLRAKYAPGGEDMLLVPARFSPTGKRLTWRKLDNFGRDVSRIAAAIQRRHMDVIQPPGQGGSQ